jgi:hypothetical protein
MQVWLLIKYYAMEGTFNPHLPATTFLIEASGTIKYRRFASENI